MAHLHQGVDRRILNGNKYYRRQVRERDERTMNPKPTRTLSTWAQVFPLDDVELQAHLGRFDDMIDRELNKVKT